MNVTKQALLYAATIGTLISSANINAAPITYEGALLSGVTQTGSISDPIDTGSDFWRFSASAGDVISLTVNRIDYNLDPAMNLYSGLFANTNDLTASIASGDDEIAHPGPYGDPRIANFNIATAGDYTVRVWDFLSGSGAPFDYSITLRGASSANVPEPGVASLLGLGIAGLLLSRRRV